MRDVVLDDDIEFDRHHSSRGLFAVARAILGELDPFSIGVPGPRGPQSDTEWLATVLKELRDQGAHVTAALDRVEDRSS
ncbi:hypothetical protein JNUCC0626_48090 [Lentzea sp. JNUCC 0626]|uniref:hypothetical protein n=1 Tax=Lentzea sp. JNUCC 0626 TaxID=3367513 RepID=UPI003748B8D3